MTDASKEAFDYQCECNLSYVSNSDKVTVEIGQQHLKDIFKSLVVERDQALAREAALKDNTQHCRELQLEVNSLKSQLQDQALSHLAAMGQYYDQITNPAHAAKVLLGDMYAKDAMVHWGGDRALAALRAIADFRGLSAQEKET